MDIFKQTVKKIKTNEEENNLNTRRYSENFPQIERKVDYIVYDYIYEMEFPLSNHPHNVSLTLSVRPPESCFQCVVGPSPIGGASCTAIGGDIGPPDGDAHAVVYSGFSTNVGGFTLDAGGGVIVPQDGIYNLVYTGSIGGVTVSDSAAIIISVRRNGVIITQKVYSVANGRLGPNPSYLSIDPNMYGLCIACRAGDTIGGWNAAGGIAFYSGSAGAQIDLVGLG